MLGALVVAACGFRFAPLSVTAIAPLSSSSAQARAGSICAAVSELSSADEFDQALTEVGDGLAIVSFSTSTCGPCKVIEPGFVRLSDTYSDYSFYKVEGDKSDDTKALFGRLGIRAVPIICFYINGACVKEVTGGAISTLDLIDAIEDLRWEPGALPPPPLPERRPRHQLTGMETFADGSTQPM